MNDKPFQHVCPSGAEFTAQRCDFVGGVKIVAKKADYTYEQLAEDVAAAIGFHAGIILPDLNGFSGYDCIRFTIER